MMVDRTDPCNSHANCGRCSEDSRCGWCAANSQCMIGSPSGPKLGMCASWTKGFCEVSKCGDYSHCMSCLADPYCGWCSAPSDDPSAAIPGKCMEGGSSGPGEAEGECPDQWRHSPVRKGTAYTLASHLASTHGPYLREVCESADGKIPYAPPPAAKPVPTAKDPVMLTMFPRDGPLFGGTHITITGEFFFCLGGGRYGRCCGVCCWLPCVLVEHCWAVVEIPQRHRCSFLSRCEIGIGVFF